MAEEVLINPKEIFNKFLHDYKKINLSWEESWGNWTTKVLGYFSDLGESLGYDVYVSPKVKEGYSEYLVDLCWAIELQEDYPTDYGIELALEEEWGDNLEEIYWDFDKLVDIKASLKVMICFPKIRDKDDILFDFRRVISKSKFKIPTERYLIIFFSRDSRRKESERIKIDGYEIDYLSNISKLASKRFPDKWKK